MARTMGQGFGRVKAGLRPLTEMSLLGLGIFAAVFG